MANRWDETWHRLLDWTSGQAPSERLAAQILIDDGYCSLDPSHPLGGGDGAIDAKCVKDGKYWLMAAYFPRGQKKFSDIKKKFISDLSGVAKNSATGICFVTNQELRLSERDVLKSLSGEANIDIFHLERITAVLDKPVMAGIRKQFLNVDYSDEPLVSSVKDEISCMQQHLEGLQTGGDSFCYWMLYHFDLSKNIARNFVVIKVGKYPLYDVRIRILDMRSKSQFTKQWGEINAPADFKIVEWPLEHIIYYRVFFHARNGSWHQDLQLKRSTQAQCWLVATRVVGNSGNVMFENKDNEFLSEFGDPVWEL